MVERFNADLGFILLALLIAWLLGFLIAWLLRGSKIKELEAEIADLKSRNAKLQEELSDTKAELEACAKERNRLAELKEALNSKMLHLNDELRDCSKSQEALALRLAEYEKPKFDADAAKKALGKKIKQDDLTVVEGIGPKIAELFNSNGINTWYDLSVSQATKLKEILDSGGDRFSFHKPDTWPKQAEMAHNGLWAELKEWQDYLDGGVEPTA